MIILQTLLSLSTGSWGHVIGWSIYLVLLITTKAYITDIEKLAQSFKDWRDSQTNSEE